MKGIKPQSPTELEKNVLFDVTAMNSDKTENAGLKSGINNHQNKISPGVFLTGLSTRMFYKVL